MREKLLLVGVAAIVLVAALPSRADTVTRSGEQRSVTGKVVGRTRDGVTVKPRTGDDVTVPANEIESVRYDGEPPKLNLGRVAERQGNLDKAIDLYKEVASDEVARPIREEIDFYMARCAAKLARSDPDRLGDAVKLLEQFQSQYATSHYFYPLHELLAEVYAAQGMSTKATEALAALAGAPWGDYQLRAAVAEGRLLVQKQDYAAAIARFDQVLAKPANGPEAEGQHRAAQLGKAVCLAGQAKYDEAEKLVDEVIEQAPPTDPVQAEAHNVLGECRRAARKPKEALIAYLYVDLMCFSEKEQHARALYALSQVWKEVGEPARAEEAMARLKSEYPNSVWAKR